MRLEDFDYPLDPSLIAQDSLETRDHARLLVVDRSTGCLSHQRIADLPELLKCGDLLVLNDTKVFPARLFGTKRPGGGKIELLLIRQFTLREVINAPVMGYGEIWKSMIKGHVRPGQQLELPGGILVTVIESQEGHHVIGFPRETNVTAYAEKHGTVPLPPYIRRDVTTQDRDRYQTIFARHSGAVAAPTAGLHFTPDLLRHLTHAGILTAMVTLHVGPGTFKPVSSPDITHHHMDPEWYDLPTATAIAVQKTRRHGGRVIAVGSTSVRVLETRVAQGLTAGTGETSLFIYPSYAFQIVDALLTNFHLPKSTLFMLVCAFAGRECMLDAYRVAAAERYRFYSYGDAMLIL
jgi:S-adenosylmethionine:tRNA ribosyltransferase-isomerase